MAKSKKLGELLTEWGVTSAKEIEKGLDHAKVKRMRLGEALIDLKLCNESQVYKALAQQNNMEYVDVDRGDLPPNPTSLIPEDLIRKYIILPLGAEAGGRTIPWPSTIRSTWKCSTSCACGWARRSSRSSRRAPASGPSSTSCST